MPSQPVVGQFKKGELVSGTSYRVEALIGSGGMGSVYRVEHRELGRTFVLKALHGHLASRKDLQARLRNEWRALGKLEHPNIVQVTDAGQTEDGLPYYVMENLRGATLGQILHEKKTLGPRRACGIAADVLAGLHAAHETGAIHRDIKPQNIFVSDDGTTKLLDFGIAKLRDQSAKVVTAGGVSIGTPRYMAPEQASGTVVDGRADIYATALVLFEMLAGRGPFAHIRDPNELVMAHIGQDPERVDFLAPKVPEELADLVQRWLSKSPDSRPISADFARRELVALLASLPEDDDTPTEEATLGGDYEASTVGAPGRLEPAASSTPNGVSSARSDSVAAPSVPEREHAVDATSTVSLGHESDIEAESSSPPVSSPPVGSPPAGSPPAGSPAVGPAGTLGWGTAEDRVSASAVSHRSAGGRGEAPGFDSARRRPSMTPPPVSSWRGGSSAGNRTTIKWIAATAAISFLAALAVSQWMAPSGAGDADETLEDASAPTETAPVAASPAPAVASPEPGPRSDVPEVGDSSSEKLALPEGSVPGARSQEPAQEPAADEVPEVKGSIDTVAVEPKPTPVRPKKVERRPSSSGSGADKLPESGLW